MIIIDSLQRHCKIHHSEITSSIDGVFDSPCSLCEAEAEDIAATIGRNPYLHGDPSYDTLEEKASVLQQNSEHDDFPF
jgi:hypothetical protein